jgi:hypothetical protein
MYCHFKQPKQTADNLEAQNIERCRKLIIEGRIGNAIQALHSSGVAPMTEETIQKLRDKHPVATLPEININPPDGYVCTEEDVRKAISSFANSSAAGPDGLYPDHVKLMIQLCHPTDEILFIQSLTRFCNVVTSGSAPKVYAPYFGSATLIPLIKLLEEQKIDLRPIALGGTVRRIIFKILQRASVADLVKIFEPYQMGVG